MKVRPSSLICSKARRASRWATSCERHKFLQPAHKPSQMCGEGFFFCRETCVGGACEFRSDFNLRCLLLVYYTMCYVPPPPHPPPLLSYFPHTHTLNSTPTTYLRHNAFTF